MIDRQNKRPPRITKKNKICFPFNNSPEKEREVLSKNTSLQSISANENKTKTEQNILSTTPINEHSGHATQVHVQAHQQRGDREKINIKVRYNVTIIRRYHCIKSPRNKSIQLLATPISSPFLDVVLTDQMKLELLQRRGNHTKTKGMAKVASL